MSVIIDVREPFEYAAGHVTGAINISPSELIEGSSKLAKVPKDTEIIVYCRTGSRSNVAMQLLSAQGYTHLINGINQHHVEATYASGHDTIMS